MLGGAAPCEVRYAGAHPYRPAPVVPPADAHDLDRYLRATRLLADADRLAAAYTHCCTAIAAATHWCSPTGLSAAYSLRSAVCRGTGDLPAAVRDADTAGELLAASGADPHGPAATLLLARKLAVLVDLGEVERADEVLAGHGPIDEEPYTLDGLLLLFGRGRAHAAAGRFGEALADLFRCGERLATRRSDRPTVLPWRSAAAMALFRTGAREAAARLAAAEIDLARRCGTPAAHGRALRTQGVVLGGRAGLALLDQAVRVLAGSPRRLELAGALIELGALLSDARRRPPARRLLREGLDLAELCGCPALMQRARREYAAAGGRLRPVTATGVSGLTAAERRTAALAATDKTNRQIAEKLFLSVRTVEIHLTNTYRKLGIAGRSELATALAAEPTCGPPGPPPG